MKHYIDLIMSMQSYETSHWFDCVNAKIYNITQMWLCQCKDMKHNIDVIMCMQTYEILYWYDYINANIWNITL